MSVLRCTSCNILIDTDDHPDAYQPDIDEWHCPDCADPIPDDGFKWILHKTDGTQVVSIEQARPSLQEMQGMVGGYIERVKIWDGETPKDMIVNEDGIALDMEPNYKGTMLYGDTVLKNTGRKSYHIVVGPVIVFENFNLR